LSSKCDREKGLMSRLKRMGEVGAAAYAGYKWLEKHADEIERGCDKAVNLASDKKYGQVVVLPATLVRHGARWLQDHGDGGRPPKQPAGV
jgi:hypothetical protein